MGWISGLLPERGGAYNTSMYTIRKSIDIDFAHTIRGHMGPCINIHGHTWKFEVEVSSSSLDKEGFVVDFKKLKTQVLKRCHDLLDHGLALGNELFAEVEGELESMGESFLAARETLHQVTNPPPPEEEQWNGVRLVYPGGMKVAIFPFSPTSERLAKWLFDAASSALNEGDIFVQCARIYETLHPVESVAEYRPSKGTS